MPLVTNSGGVNIPFNGDADDLVAESKRVIKSLDEIKSHTKTMSEESIRHAQEMEKAAQTQTMSITDFRSAYQIALDVVRVGQQVWDEVGQKFVDNAVEVGDFARSLGTTTEEASRLKEVADDVGIGVDTLRTSLKMAQKDGLTPTIDGLAKMADEYNALAPGVERTQFLLDRFGKSGEDMGKLLEKGSTSIKDMAAAMDDGLIVTQEAYEQARQYQISVDAIKDSWDALTYSAAPPLVDAVTNVINATRDETRARELATEAGQEYLKLSGYQQRAFVEQAAAERELADAALLAKDSAEDAAGAFETEAEAAARIKEEAKLAEQAIKDLTKANQEELNTLGQLTGKINDYNEKQNDLKTQQEELLARKQALIDNGWNAEGDSIDDLNKKLAENQAKQKENAEAFTLATNQRILARAEELLSADGLTTAEKDMLIERGLAMGVYTAEAAARMKEEEQAAKDLAASLNAIPNIERTVTINTVHTGTPYNAGSDVPAQGSVYQGHASGGQFLIPMSYGNEGFRMGNGDTASGGETVTITPRGQQPGGGLDDETRGLLRQMANNRLDPQQFAIAIRDALEMSGLAAGR